MADRYIDPNERGEGGQNQSFDDIAPSGSRHYGGDYDDRRYPVRPGSYQDYRANYGEHERAKPQGKGNALAVLGVLLALVLAIGMVGLSTYGVYTFLTRDILKPTKSLPSVPSIERRIEEGVDAPTLDIRDRPTEAVVPKAEQTDGRMTTVEIAKKVSPSVVGITMYSGYNMFEPSGQGSGIVMDSEGYILTNAHVVSDAVGINVEMTDGESFPALLIGYDSKTDLAVIKIEAEGLEAAEFGNSDALEVGEKVIAIGNPAGSILAGSITQGIVSGKNRVLNDSGYSSTYIQVDAAINPGNSGGALVNEYGQVVGINSAKIADINYEGIGFAIPINEAKPIIDELIKYGYVRGRTKLGLSGTEINEALAYMNDLPVGIYIWTVDAKSDLAGKGIAKGDIVTHIDGKRIEKFDDLTSVLKSKKPGDSVRLTVYRSSSRSRGQSFDVTVELMEDIDEGYGKGQPRS